MKRLRGFIKENDEFLASLIALVGSVGVILNAVKVTSFQYIENINLFTDGLNLAVLFIGLFFIRKTILVISEDENIRICEQYNITKQGLLDKVIRTNSLIGQLYKAIRWFIIILIGFYLLQFYVDSFFDYDWFKGVLKVKDKDYIDLVINSSSKKKSAAQYLAIEVLTNATNLFSATFLFTAFLVLFSVTLEDDNRTSKINNQIPLAIAIGITILNILVLSKGIPGLTIEESATIVRLFGGLYNGIAMALLFSRFISMEYYFQSSNKSFERLFYFYGITIWLPLYVVVQPLYSLFNLFDLGQTAVIKAIVFLITFWGKLVFLFFIYTMLNKKWIHSYILLTLMEKDKLEKLSFELKDVEKLRKD